MVLLLWIATITDAASFGTMSFQMVLLHYRGVDETTTGFGTMSFQMVLLHAWQGLATSPGFGTMSFQMVLLPPGGIIALHRLFWNYVIPDGSTTTPSRPTP